MIKYWSKICQLIYCILRLEKERRGSLLRFLLCETHLFQLLTTDHFFNYTKIRTKEQCRGVFSSLQLYILPNRFNIIEKIILLLLSSFPTFYSSPKPWYSLPLFTTWYSFPIHLICNFIHPWNNEQDNVVPENLLEFGLYVAGVWQGWQVLQQFPPLGHAQSIRS